MRQVFKYFAELRGTCKNQPSMHYTLDGVAVCGDENDIYVLWPPRWNIAGDVPVRIFEKCRVDDGFRIRRILVGLTRLW